MIVSAGRSASVEAYIIRLQLDCSQMDCGRYLCTACLAMFNMTAVTLAETVSLWPLAKWRIQFGYELPTVLTTMWHIVLFAGIHEIGFYYTHR